MSEHEHRFKSLRVTYGKEGSILHGPSEVSVEVTHKDAVYTVSIEQGGERVITVGAPDPTLWSDLQGPLYCIERLLMVFDGAFIPLIRSEFIDSPDGDDGMEEALQMQAQRLHYFDTDERFGIRDRLVDHKEVLTSGLVTRWQHLIEELDIAHPMYLYAMSDSGMPIDLRLAHIIELAEPLVELIDEERGLFPSMTSNKDRRPPLKAHLNAVINAYGSTIFKREMQGGGYAEFLSKLVNSRVRIMHIKRRQSEEKYFGGSACSCYMMKLSLLYRVVLLDLLGIPEEAYRERLVKKVATIDRRYSVDQL